MSALTDLSNNKIGDSTGDTTCLWFFVGHLLFTYSFYLKSVSESVGDPFRLSGFKIPLRCFSLFSKFLDFSNTSALYPLHCLWKHSISMHPGCLLQCGISTPYLFLACRNSPFRTVLYYQPAVVFVKFLIWVLVSD
jgi:hypothetical protein